MELSQEKKTQIAACHGKGMTVKEIAKTANLTEGQVDVFLQSIGKKPLYRRYLQKHNRLTEEQKQQLIELFQEGKCVTEISKITGINIKTVDYYRPKIKRKEPATAATVTDSVDVKTDVCDTVSISNDNTGSQKSQALSPFTALTLLETLLDNWVGNEYEKEYMQAHKNAAALIFIYKGRKYSFQFKECKEVVGE